MSGTQFNLGLLNVDTSMNVGISFETLEGLEIDIGIYHYEADVYWYSSENKGWNEILKFQADGIDISDDIETDINYFTDPSKWLQTDDGSYINIIRDSQINATNSANVLSGNIDNSIGKDFFVGSGYLTFISFLYSFN